MEKLSGSEPFNHGCLDFEGRIWLAISFSFEAPLSIQTALGRCGWRSGVRKMLTGRFVGSFKVIGKLADENTGILVSVFAASFQ